MSKAEAICDKWCDYLDAAPDVKIPKPKRTYTKIINCHHSDLKKNGSTPNHPTPFYDLYEQKIGGRHSF